MKKLKFTKKQVESFIQWEKDYQTWEKGGFDVFFLPPKPPYFDLWKAGPDPLSLSKLPVIPCPGSDSITKIHTR